jgi:protein-disulfide isomerase
MSPSAKYRRKLKAGQAEPESIALRVWTIKGVGTLWVGLLMLVLGALCGIAVQPLFAAAPRPVATATGQASSTEQVEPTNPAPTQDNSPRGAMMRGVVSQTRHFIGDENAPVTIVEFCDFEVPECAQFADQVHSQLKEAYVDTGKVRFGFWPMATLSEGSQLAAEAAECAAEQDAFWQFYAAVYAKEANSSENFDKAGLNAFAAELGLDTAAFTECLDSGKYTDVIKEGTTTIQDLGLPEIPTFLLNGQALVGFQTIESLQQTIDALLADQ